MSSQSTASSTTSSDADAVEAAARDYIEGWYTGNAERMERSLHDDLVKRTPVERDGSGASALRMVSKARMVELTTAGGGTDVAVPAIEILRRRRVRRHRLRPSRLRRLPRLFASGEDVGRLEDRQRDLPQPRLTQPAARH